MMVQVVSTLFDLPSGPVIVWVLVAAALAAYATIGRPSGAALEPAPLERRAAQG